MDPAELARWTRFAMKGGIGRCTAILDCVQEREEDLMFLKDDEIVVLLQVPDHEGVYLGYCEGVIGRFQASDVRIHGKLKKPVMAKRASSNSVSSLSNTSGTNSPYGTNTPPSSRLGGTFGGSLGGGGSAGGSRTASPSIQLADRELGYIVTPKSMQRQYSSSLQHSSSAPRQFNSLPGRNSPLSHIQRSLATPPASTPPSRSISLSSSGHTATHAPPSPRPLLANPWDLPSATTSSPPIPPPLPLDDEPAPSASLVSPLDSSASATFASLEKQFSLVEAGWKRHAGGGAGPAHLHTYSDSSTSYDSFGGASFNSDSDLYDPFAADPDPFAPRAPQPRQDHTHTRSPTQSTTASFDSRASSESPPPFEFDDARERRAAVADTQQQRLSFDPVNPLRVMKKSPVIPSVIPTAATQEATSLSVPNAESNSPNVSAAAATTEEQHVLSSEVGIARKPTPPQSNEEIKAEEHWLNENADKAPARSVLPSSVSDGEEEFVNENAGHAPKRNVLRSSVRPAAIAPAINDPPAPPKAVLTLSTPAEPMNPTSTSFLQLDTPISPSSPPEALSTSTEPSTNPTARLPVSPSLLTPDTSASDSSFALNRLSTVSTSEGMTGIGLSLLGSLMRGDSGDSDDDYSSDESLYSPTAAKAPVAQSQYLQPTAGASNLNRSASVRSDGTIDGLRYGSDDSDVDTEELDDGDRTADFTRGFPMPPSHHADVLQTSRSMSISRGQHSRIASGSAVIAFADRTSVSLSQQSPPRQATPQHQHTPSRQQTPQQLDQSPPQQSPPQYHHRDRRPSIAPSIASSLAASLQTTASWEGADDIYDDYRYSRFSMSSYAAPGVVSHSTGGSSGGSWGRNAGRRASQASAAAMSPSMRANEVPPVPERRGSEGEAGIPMGGERELAKEKDDDEAKASARPRDSDASVYTQGSGAGVGEGERTSTVSMALSAFGPARPTPLNLGNLTQHQQQHGQMHHHGSISTLGTIPSASYQQRGYQHRHEQSQSSISMSDQQSPLLHATWGSPISSPEASATSFKLDGNWVGPAQHTIHGVVDGGVDPVSPSGREFGVGNAEGGARGGGAASAMRHRIEEEKREGGRIEEEKREGGKDERDQESVDLSVLEKRKIVVDDEDELPSHVEDSYASTAAGDRSILADSVLGSRNSNTSSLYDDDDSTTQDHAPHVSVLPHTPIAAAAPSLPPSAPASPETRPSPPDFNITSPSQPPSPSSTPTPTATPRPSHLRPSLRDLREGGTITVPGTNERRSLFMPHPNAPKSPMQMGLESPGPMYVRDPAAPPLSPNGPTHFVVPPPGAPLQNGQQHPPQRVGTPGGWQQPRLTARQVIIHALTRPPPPPMRGPGGRPLPPRGPTIYGRIEGDFAMAMGPIPIVWSVDIPPTKARVGVAPGQNVAPPLGIVYGGAPPPPSLMSGGSMLPPPANQQLQPHANQQLQPHANQQLQPHATAGHIAQRSLDGPLPLPPGMQQDGPPPQAAAGGHLTQSPPMTDGNLPLPLPFGMEERGFGQPVPFVAPNPTTAQPQPRAAIPLSTRTPPPPSPSPPIRGSPARQDSTPLPTTSSTPPPRPSTTGNTSRGGFFSKRPSIASLREAVSGPQIKRSSSAMAGLADRAQQGSVAEEAAGGGGNALSMKAIPRANFYPKVHGMGSRPRSRSFSGLGSIEKKVDVITPVAPPSPSSVEVKKAAAAPRTGGTTVVKGKIIQLRPSPLSLPQNAVTTAATAVEPVQSPPQSPSVQNATYPTAIMPHGVASQISTSPQHSPSSPLARNATFGEQQQYPPPSPIGGPPPSPKRRTHSNAPPLSPRKLSFGIGVMRAASPEANAPLPTIASVSHPQHNFVQNRDSRSPPMRPSSRPSLNSVSPPPGTPPSPGAGLQLRRLTASKSAASLRNPEREASWEEANGFHPPSNLSASRPGASLPNARGAGALSPPPSSPGPRIAGSPSPTPSSVVTPPIDTSIPVTRVDSYDDSRSAGSGGTADATGQRVMSPSSMLAGSPASSNGLSPMIVKRDSLKAKLSLPNLRRNRSRQDSVDSVPYTPQEIPSLLQVQDMEFELVRPAIGQFGAARASEDSGVLGREHSLDNAGPTVMGGGGPGGGNNNFLRTDSLAHSMASDHRPHTGDSNSNSGSPWSTAPPRSPFGPSPTPFAAGPSVPQDPATMEAHRNRELKWMTLLGSLPPAQARKSKKTRKLLLDGVPFSVRYLVWSHLTDGKAKCVPGVYPQLCKRGRVQLSERIEADVANAPWFNNDARGQLAVLREAGGGVVQLLQAYLNMVPDIQYSPGLPHIVGQLLMLAPEEDAFWIFVSIMDTHIRPYFSTTSSQMEVDAALFSRALEVNDAAVAKKLFVDMGIAPVAICQPWFSSLFVGCLPDEYLARTWDMFLYDGVPFLIRIGVAIVSFVRLQLLQCTSEQDVLAVLHRPPTLRLPTTTESYLAFAFSLKLKDDDVRKLRVKMEAQVKRQIQQQQHPRSAGSISLPR